MCGILRKGTSEFIYKTEIEKKLMAISGQGGRDKLGDWD